MNPIQDRYSFQSSCKDPYNFYPTEIGNSSSYVLYSCNVDRLNSKHQSGTKTIIHLER